MAKMVMVPEEVYDLFIEQLENADYDNSIYERGMRQNPAEVHERTSVKLPDGDQLQVCYSSVYEGFPEKNVYAIHPALMKFSLYGVNIETELIEHGEREARKREVAEIHRRADEAMEMMRAEEMRKHA